MALLAVRHLTFTYPGCGKPAVRDVSLTVERGEMIAVCGPTGCGKSTLLRLMKRELTPHGDLRGEIAVEGLDASAARIGYVMQRPEHQIVTDKVWHELAFGLENLGTPQPVIARRVAEMAAYFGIEDWFDRDVSTLSGGQKQLLNLASVMVMQPELLILDEPTAQLDPIAASEFITTVRKLNRELGLTVIMTEHRLEELIPVCDRLLVMQRGRVRYFGEPARIAARMAEQPELLPFLPAAARLYHELQGSGSCPLDVREGRVFLTDWCGEKHPAMPEEAPLNESNPPALNFKEVYFRYGRSEPDVLRGMSFTVRAGEICCMLGGNGSGKSTTLSVAAGLEKAYSGKVEVFGKPLRSYRNQSLYRECLTLLPQDVQRVFLCNTVRKELAECSAAVELLPFDLTGLLDRHPYDLSGGEQQLVALAKVLATKPKLLLLDEPTKGVDAAAKARLINVLKALREQGMTILIVTHDVELAAECADRCCFVFRGQIVSIGTPRAFFRENSFYTTAVSRMSRGLIDGAVTVSDVAGLFPAGERQAPSDAEDEPDIPEPEMDDSNPDVPGERSNLPDKSSASPTQRFRTFWRFALPLAAMPALVLIGTQLAEGRQHLIVSLGMACMALLLFFAGIECRETSGRRMVIVSVMTALCIVGRFIPLFKPVTALTIITGIYLGGEAGFLVGALSAALSNFYFGQGPWTAFQMLGWGFIGLISGWLAAPLKRQRWQLMLWGVLAGAVYSLIMDVWNVLWYAGGFDWTRYTAAVATALPHTLLYVASNFVFLWFLAQPFGEKLERVVRKYGI